MPSRTITYLGASCAAVFTLYVGFMLAAITFAAAATELASSIRESESALSVLENKYYDRVTLLTSADPGAVGLVAPERVQYITSEGVPSLTRADR